MLTTHSHTTHKLQPLDKTVFGPFKEYFDRFLDNWIKCNPVSTFTIYQIAALRKKRTIELSAFKATGVFAMKRYIWRGRVLTIRYF